MVRSLGMALGLACLVAAAPQASQGATVAPYAGWQDRGIKSLSEQQVDDLRAGRGMSLALAAELNGYPGPRHVLDLGDDLALTAAQRASFEGLFQEMQAEAQRLGAAILDQEAALDRAFGDGQASDAALRAALADLADLQGELRYTHLRSHLTARSLLTADQVARYTQLRGYGNEARQGGTRDHGHGHAPAAE